MKPIIGVTASIDQKGEVELSHENIDAIVNAGGIPVIIPNLLNVEDVERIANRIDGLLITGRGDIDPTLFGEEPHPNLGRVIPERDLFEVEIIRQLAAKNKPMLGICRGIQILNVALGGDMYQDIYDQIDKPLLQHDQKSPRYHGSHFIEVTEDSLFQKIVQTKKYKINSFHHQAVRNLAPRFQVSAVSSDGIIEAMESTSHAFIIGVQWHPECMVSHGDVPSQKLFNAFVGACHHPNIVEK